MTIKIQPPNIFDQVLSILGKKRAMYLPKKAMSEKFGIYLAPKENFFRCLLRKNNDTLPSGWIYPDDLA